MFNFKQLNNTLQNNLGIQRLLSVLQSISLKSEAVIVCGIYFLLAIMIHHRLWLGEVPIAEDSRHHYFWIQNFALQFFQGDLYPRWISESNYRYGSPTFVFYPPLLYYFTTLLKALGLDFERTIAALFTIITLAFGFFGYLCKRKDWGRIAAFFTGLFFLIDPYHLFNLYQRAALGESLAMSFIPCGIWLTNQAIQYPKRRILLVPFALLLALTHLPSLLLFSIFWLSYVVIASFRRTSIKQMLLILAAIFLGWGIASFYLIPVILEKSWVSIEGMKLVSGGYSANLYGSPEVNNFAREVFSIWKDQIRIFSILMVTALVGCVRNIRKREEWILLIVSFTTVSLAMSQLSRPIWDSIATLQSVQFPWRLMGLISVLTALSVGFCLSAFRNYIFRSFTLMLVGAVLIFGLRNTKRLVVDAPTLQKPRWFLEEPKFLQKMEDTKLAVEEPFSGLREDVPEYRPAIPEGKTSEYQPQRNTPPVTVKDGDFKIESWKVKRRTVSVETPVASLVTFRVYDYPAWNAYVNGKPQSIERSPEGTISVRVPAGKHRVELKYEWTRAMYIGTAISLICIILTLGLFVGIGL